MISAANINEQSGRQILDSLDVIGDYIIEGTLGEGRFGIVYKAKHRNTGHPVAVKLLKVWSVPQHAQMNLIRRFELEFETGQIKSDHLVHTIEMDQIEGIPFIVMDYYPGGNLERKINAGITQDEAIVIAKGILRGLNDLHRNGKIHRDLKPENVLFDDQGRPRLTDFGISGHINIQLTVVNQDDHPEQVFGSYAYMAPEQLSPIKRNNTLLPTIDIFSYGVLCFEMFHNSLPFGPWKSHDDIDPYVRRAASGMTGPIKEDLSPIWKEILIKCLNPDRERRFQNTDAIFALLRPGASDEKQPVKSSFTLQILDGEEYDRQDHIRLDGFARMGRATSFNDNEIEIMETISNYISRRHATFETIGSAVYLRDGQWIEDGGNWKFSKNGTYVNGLKIDDEEGFQLYQNDIITIGNTSIKII